MELILLGCLVVLLAILTVVIIILTQSITRISRLEQDALQRAELTTQTPDSLLPKHLQLEFDEIAQKHQKYFDTLLQTSITAFDKQFHEALQAQQKKQLHNFDKQFESATHKLNSELQKITERSLKQSDGQLDLVNTQTKKMNTMLQQQLREHFTEIAWQYIAESLQSSLDLHSQKDAIFEELNKHKAELKKDYHAS